MCRFASADRRRGFSLVELIVMVAVLAVIAAMVAPRIGRSDASVLRMAAQQLAADFRLIQNEAMAHGDSVRVLDWQVSTGGPGYALLNDIIENSWGNDGDGYRIDNQLTNRDYRVEFGEPPFEHLAGVWMAKSNLGEEVTSHRGIIRFGRYGQVLDFTYDPVMILAAGDKTLRVTLDRDTGEATIAPNFGDYANIGSESLPGPNSAVRTEASPHD